jgi:hypothetical protein
MSLLSSAAYVSVPKRVLCGERAHTRQAITAQTGRIYCYCHYRTFDFVPGDLLLTGVIHELRKQGNAGRIVSHRSLEQAPEKGYEALVTSISDA